MIDDLVGFAVAVAIDIETAKAAKRHRWVRIVRLAVAFFFLAVIAAGIFVTFKYS